MRNKPLTPGGKKFRERIKATPKGVKVWSRITAGYRVLHMMPVSAVWAGPERNAHLDGP
jgi:hypothetical protein